MSPPFLTYCVQSGHLPLHDLSAFPSFSWLILLSKPLLFVTTRSSESFFHSSSIIRFSRRQSVQVPFTCRFAKPISFCSIFRKSTVIKKARRPLGGLWKIIFCDRAVLYVCIIMDSFFCFNRPFYPYFCWYWHLPFFMVVSDYNMSSLYPAKEAHAAYCSAQLCRGLAWLG